MFGLFKSAVEEGVGAGVREGLSDGLASGIRAALKGTLGPLVDGAMRLSRAQAFVAVADYIHAHPDMTGEQIESVMRAHGNTLLSKVYSQYPEWRPGGGAHQGGA